MFDMSWGEIMVIGGVALVVIGPKDLPKALRTVGQMTTKVRRLASEFQSQFSEAMREAELDEVRKEMEGLNRQVSTATSAAFNPIQTIRDELKGAVETPSGSVAASSAAASSTAVAGPVVPVEEFGPVPQIEPMTEFPAPSASLPVSDGPAPLATGPGLEGGAEPLPPATPHADPRQAKGAAA
ncbi:MAG: tatB [Enterovirga sp.]|nr:tatB [Enterovirga sp.]